MPALTEWKVPPANQPRSADYGFDLDAALASVVGLHSSSPPTHSAPIHSVPNAPAMASSSTTAWC